MPAPRPLDVSVRDAIVPLALGQSLFQALRALGVSSVELLIEPDGRASAVQLEDGSAPLSIADAPGVASLRQRFADEGVRVSALLLGTDFSGPDAGAHVAWVIAATAVAAELGAPVVRVDTFTRRATL